MFVPTAYDAPPDLRVGLNFYERRKKFLFAGCLSIIYGLNLRAETFLSMICHRIRDRGLNSYPNTCCVIKINATSCWEGLYLSMHIHVGKNPTFVCSGVDFFSFNLPYYQVQTFLHNRHMLYIHRYTYIE